MPDSPYDRVELLLRPDIEPPAKYTDVDRVTEHDFAVQAGPCRQCKKPRYTHRWVLYQGDHLLDCSENQPF